MLQQITPSRKLSISLPANDAIRRVKALSSEQILATGWSGCAGNRRHRTAEDANVIVGIVTDDHLRDNIR
jgi:hypothetical protein